MNADEIFEYTSDNGVCFAQVLLITEIIMNYEEPMHLALVQCIFCRNSKSQIPNTKHSKSELQFPKLHSWVFHICSSIREFDAINGYTTETYESLHKDYVKKPYKLTNKKEIEKQIMKIIRRKAIITESFSKEIPKIQ
ncbi:hypothetical protein Glove_352g8 [Diversispora epigaea]|uniref:Uncharacterized protein n=1 Tax=Diversispora epigaea TaxID=1348612 RepID=A0A397HBR7_9GLOM|nr:hypothetical protein Glove_352g8 [Diversispora epigaea]